MTGTQRKIMAVIRRMVADRGYPPSVRELCVETGIRSPSTIHYHLKELIEQGMIVQERSETGRANARTLRIVEEGDR